MTRQPLPNIGAHHRMITFEIDLFNCNAETRPAGYALR
jgi:hypothetical protein